MHAYPLVRLKGPTCKTLPHLVVRKHMAKTYLSCILVYTYALYSIMPMLSQY